MARARRGATDLNGVLLVDKPAGITSHDVVDRLRAITGEGRIGHAGTLDPQATGLLVVCIGPATRLSEQLMGHDKSYVARVIFGTATDTDDAEGQVIATASGHLPAELSNPDFARQVLDSFIGEQEQVPPQYSAIKQAGVAAYKKARQGKQSDLAARPVRIITIDLLAQDSQSWDIAVHVSKGTYIRSLARDIGDRVGCFAHLGPLRRTSIGPWSVTQAYSLEKLAEMSRDQIAAAFLSEEELGKSDVKYN